jgi:DeoR family transcriptional regulator, glycerol-3-phosphate regulon repressor
MIVGAGELEMMDQHLPVLSAIRHETILRELEAAGRVRVSVLAPAFGVSEETIRRDLTELEAQSLLRRVHGGAVRHEVDREQPILERSRVKAREKIRIGQIAAGLVRDGMSVFIDTGSTPVAVAQALAKLTYTNVTVTTNSLDIGRILAQTAGLRVRMTPGMLRANDNAIVGHETCDYLRRFAFDLSIVGIAACDLEFGWMDYGQDESDLRRIVAANAQPVAIVCDDSKFGRRASITTYALDQAMTIVTNKPLPPEFSRRFDRAGIEVKM